jgi:AAA15 family ATPase/GTPase
MKPTPIYIKSLELKDIRTFGEVFLNLETEKGIIPHWTLILGDNSIGKSTLLQCIAWMKPLLPYNLEKTRGFVAGPIINDEQNEVLNRLVRKNKTEAYLKAVFIANKRLDTKNSSKAEITCTTTMGIQLNKKGKLDEVFPKFYTKSENKKLFFTKELLLFAYGASRRLGKLNLNNPHLIDTIPNFVAETTELYDAEEILHTLNYNARASKTKAERKKYSDFLGRIKNMLVRVLPDFEKIQDIDVSPPKIMDQDVEGGILITTKHGVKIPFGDFSLGYKTVTSLTIDLAWRLLKKYQDLPSNEDPLEQPAIVIIDEIDLHLHPVWQREIMSNLSNTFRNVQFIATAHTPLMVQAAVDANYAVLKHEEDGVKVENNPKGIDGWRVDQILTSDFFGLQSARGIKYEELYNEREKLVNAKRLTQKQKERLAAINKELNELPSGESPKEIENRKLITEIVAKARQNKTKIEL